MRISLTYLFVVNFIYFLSAQNNGIFVGGFGDGHSTVFVSIEDSTPEMNNDIFVGGFGDGHSSLLLIQQPTPQASMNNGIFIGGIGDGYDIDTVETIVTPNNDIFVGGFGDGHSTVLLIQQSTPQASMNNGIFTGGIGDGHDIDTVETIITPNNDIFAGGFGDGHSRVFLIQQSIPQASMNNGIFTGGFGDGHDIDTIETIVTPNNDIFAGGFGDGHSTVLLIQQSTPQASMNNGIFIGGTGDGHDIDTIETIVTPNNDIFAGGFGDGHSTVLLIKQSTPQVSMNNEIFIGGTGDGHDVNIFQIIPNNNIFAGGLDDGHDVTFVAIPGSSVIVWKGYQSTNWNDISNWNLGRIPNETDIVFIDAEVNQLTLQNNLKIGGTPTSIYFAEEMYILDGSTVSMSSSKHIRIFNKLSVAGILEVYDIPSKIPIIVRAQGELIVTDTGEIRILE